MRRRSSSDTADPIFLEHVLRGFLRSLAHDLRQEGLAAEGCTVKLKDTRFAITTRQRRFSHPLDYDPDMWPTVRQALHELMKPGSEYRLAGLALSSLMPVPASLYDQRRRKAIEAMDAITARHGAVIGLGGIPDDDERLTRRRSDGRCIANKWRRAFSFYPNGQSV